jgi:hypothetical protein
MLQSHMSFDPQLAVIEPPRCPKYNRLTLFTGIKSGSPGLYLRIFECRICGYTEKIADEIK